MRPIEFNTLRDGLGNGNRPDFGTVRLRVQIPGRRPRVARRDDPPGRHRHACPAALLYTQDGSMRWSLARESPGKISESRVELDKASRKP